jgi:hypothetical protein
MPFSATKVSSMGPTLRSRVLILVSRRDAGIVRSDIGPLSKRSAPVWERVVWGLKNGESRSGGNRRGPMAGRFLPIFRRFLAHGHG